MRAYKSIKVKINHPWWHKFFTTIYSWGADGSYERWYCSKCNKVFNFDAEEVEIIEVNQRTEG